MSPVNSAVMRSDDEASAPLSPNSMPGEFANYGCNYDCGLGCKPSNERSLNEESLLGDDDARSGGGGSRRGSIEVHSDDETVVNSEIMVGSISSVASSGADMQQDRFEAIQPLWREAIERFQESYLDPTLIISDPGATRSDSSNSYNDSLNPEYNGSESRRSSSSGSTAPRPLSPGGVYLTDLRIPRDPGYKFTNSPLRLSPYNIHCRGNMILPD
jgi:hypothetical protein